MKEKVAKVEVKTRSGRVATRISLKSINEQKSTDHKSAVKKSVGKASTGEFSNVTTRRNTRTKNGQKNDLLSEANTESLKVRVGAKETKVKVTKRSKQGKTSDDINKNNDSNAPEQNISNKVKKQLPNDEESIEKQKPAKSNISKQNLSKNDESINAETPAQSKKRFSKISFINFETVSTSTPILTKTVDKNVKVSEKRLSRNQVKPLGNSQKSTKADKINSSLNITQTVERSILKPSQILPIYKRPFKRSPKKHVLLRDNAKNLRPRRQANKKYVDYENSETVISDDDNQSNANKNAPIYKQTQQRTEKKAKDVYEFETDKSENSQSDSDNEYDKEMIEEMQEIKKIERKQAKTNIKKVIASKAKNKAQDKPAPIKATKKHDLKVLKTKEVKKVAVLENKQVNISSEAAEDVSEVLQHNNFPPETNFVSDLVDSFMQPDKVGNVSVTKQNTTFKKPLMAQPLSKPLISNFRRPAANSTMTFQASSPRRSNLVLRNGPYFLQTKRDSLPSFNQDVVLNSTIVESHEPVFNCRISAILPPPPQHIKSDKDDQKVKQSSPKEAAITKLPKQTKQTSILKYIPGKERQEVDLHSTLFDENLLLSPVKNSTPLRNIKASPDKRRVLRDMTNLQTSISNTPNTPERDVSDVEFFALSARVEPIRFGKPTRFGIKSPSEVKEPHLQQNDVEEKAPADASVFDSPASESQNVDAKDLVGIFEDCEGLEVTRNELPSFTYARKLKRVRRVSYDTEDEDQHDDEHKTKRKKKRGMTKKETEEFEAWVTSTNKQHNEIDQCVWFESKLC